MKIIGVSCFYHDSSAALVVDGGVVAAIQEERLSRIKNDASFPTQSIKKILEIGKLRLSDIDAVVFYEKPLLKLDRLLESFLHITPSGLSYFVDTLQEATQKTLWCRTVLMKSLQEIDSKFIADRLFFSEHHLSHAASAYFPSPFDSAVVLTMDGMGEWASTSVSVGNNDHLEVKKEIYFPHSLGLFYSTLTAFCGFKVNSGEYKLMGLAPYGKPCFSELFLKELIELREDGSFKLNLKYFNFSSTQHMHNRAFVDLLNTQPRTPETWIEPIYMDIAASAQKTLEAAILNLTKSLWQEYKNPNLCLAGGVALNCVSNSAILQQKLFKNIWIQPAAGDAGASLGAALALHSQYFKKPRFKAKFSDTMNGSYLGNQYNSEYIEETLNHHQLNYERFDENTLLKKVSLHLIKGSSVGWFQGRMEFGPRALGSRSILADPRGEEMQKRLNLKIKFRESFRPFAPVILQENVADWFEALVPESPYMLFVDSFLQNKPPLPAITHLDGSARLQTVTKESNPRLYLLLKEFKSLTGVPMLVNTSFNVRGEPIVESPQDAINCFLKTDLDLLVIDNFLVEKNNNMGKTLKNVSLNILD